MNLLVAAKLSDQKLTDFLTPLSEVSFIKKILLVRRYPIECKKVICYCPPKILRWSRILSEFYRLLTIFFLCLTKRPDTLLGVYYYFHMIFIFYAAAVFRKPFGVCVVEDPQLYKGKKIFEQIVRRAKFITVRGSVSKNFLIKQFKIDEKKVFILPDVYGAQPQISAYAHKKYDFIYLGYLRPEKRVDIFIEVVAKIKNKIPNIQAVIVGDGPLENSLKKLVKEKNLQQAVFFAGFQNDIVSFLNKSKILMVTSQTEGLPVACVEAMMCGIPCIVSDVGDITDIAKDHYNALVVKPLNIDQFAQAGIALLKDQKLYSKLAENAQIFYKQKINEYSSANISRVWDNILRSDQ